MHLILSIMRRVLLGSALLLLLHHLETAFKVSEVSDCGFERHTIDYAFAVLNNYPFKLEVELSLHI